MTPSLCCAKSFVFGDGSDASVVICVSVNNLVEPRSLVYVLEERGETV